MICFQDDTTFAIYRNVARGLFERHKLIFSFMVSIDIIKQEGHVTELEWNYFLRGAAGVEKERPPKPAVEWLTDEVSRFVFA